MFQGSIGSPEKEKTGSLASSQQSLGRPISRLHTPTQGMIRVPEKNVNKIRRGEGVVH